MIVGGVLGALGLAVLVVARGRLARLAALGAVLVGGSLLVVTLRPEGNDALLAVAAVFGVAAAVGLAALFLRWPWLLPMAALACAPARVPVKVGGEEASLLLPLYAVVIAGVFALAWELFRRAGPPRELGPLAWPLAAFIAWAGISLVWSDGARLGAVSLAAFYLPFGLLALMLARLPWQRRWLKALTLQLIAMAVVFAGIGIYQWLTRDVFWNPKVIIGNVYAPFYRVNSLFWDPSIYGRFLVVAILASLVLVVHGAARRVVVAASAAIVVSWIGLVFSFSQSSFVALVAGVAIVAWFAWGRRTLALLGVIAVVVLVAALAMPSARHHSLNSASGGRFKLVKNGIAIAAHHPLQGVGIGGFKKAYAARTGLKGKEPKAAASHDTPVTVAAETGIVGLALFGWLLVAAFLLAFRGVVPTFAGRVSLILGVVLAAIGVHSLFYNAFFEDPMAWGVFGLAPLAAVALARERVSEPRPQAAAPQPAVAAAPQAGRSRAEAG